MKTFLGCPKANSVCKFIVRARNYLLLLEVQCTELPPGVQRPKSFAYADMSNGFYTGWVVDSE